MTDTEFLKAFHIEPFDTQERPKPRSSNFRYRHIEAEVNAAGRVEMARETYADLIGSNQSLHDALTRARRKRRVVAVVLLVALAACLLWSIFLHG